MGNPRARYTLEFKLEAVRMVKGGQSLAAVAKILDIRPQTLHNWIKAEQQGRLGGAGSPAVSAEQMEIARLKAELAPDIVPTFIGWNEPKDVHNVERRNFLGFRRRTPT